MLIQTVANLVFAAGFAVVPPGQSQQTPVQHSQSRPTHAQRMPVRSRPTQRPRSALQGSRNQSARQRAAPRRAQRLTMDQAVHKVQKKTGGRILSADRVRGVHGERYRIKALTGNGRVRVFQVHSDPDANTSDRSSKQAQKGDH